MLIKLLSTFVVAALVLGPSGMAQLDLDDDDRYAMSDRFIDKINSMQSTWKAGRNFDPNVTTMDDIRKLCGVMDYGDDVDEWIENNRWLANDIVRKIPDQLLNADIPEEYDARKAWPNCSTIGLIRDQGSCGSCWAFSVADTITDRICVASNGKQNPQISAEDLLSCCGMCGMGCEGGNPIMAWLHYIHFGLSSGGLHQSKNGCKPYSIPSCDHLREGSSRPPCSKEVVPTPNCASQCTNPSHPTAYQQDKHRGKPFSLLIWSNLMRETQLEIMQHGSVSAAFDVYADFPHYKSGVYQHVTGKLKGGHAVRIFGWGVENGTPYWLVANSWNEEWGDGGFFKIKRGNNECRIETLITGAAPLL